MHAPGISQRPRCHLHGASICIRTSRQTVRPVAAASAGVHATADDVELGQTGRKVSALGIGTLQWGDPGTGFGSRFREVDCAAMFETAVQGGITFWDTAEVYGFQNIKMEQGSEQILGRLVNQQRSGQQSSGDAAASSNITVGTKFFTVPWTAALGVGGGVRLGRKSLIAALERSLQRLGLPSVELYSVHFPLPFFPNQVLADALHEAVDRGLCQHVGVCNFSISQMQDIHSRLQKRGIALASNQVAYSLLKREPETSGLLVACRDLGITPVAHSPLSQGLLTDKWVSGGGPKEAEKIRLLLKLLQFIGAVSGGKSVTQVALNYLMTQGALPIPGAKSVQQVQDHVGAMRWRLEENEIEIIKEKLTTMKL